MKIVLSLTVVLIIWTTSTSAKVRMLPRPPAKLRLGQHNLIKLGDKSNREHEVVVYKDDDIVDSKVRRKQLDPVYELFDLTFKDTSTEKPSLERTHQTEFDEDGVIYLTKPKPSRDRDFNRLMNKVMNYPIQTEKRVSEEFNDEEIETLQKISVAIQNELPYNAGFKGYNFEDLVV